MVFGRSQRQETGFVIAGYVLAKEQRGLTSDYKRFPLPSSPAKGRRRCCLGPKPETRKRKSPENHLWPRPAGRHERRTAISFKSLVFRGPEVCFLGSKENSPEGEEEENLCAEPSLEHVFFFFSLDGFYLYYTNIHPSLAPEGNSGSMNVSKVNVKTPGPR